MLDRSIWWVIALLLVSVASALSAERPEPSVYLPFCRQAPSIDGRLAPGEWKYAATVTLLEAYPSGDPQVLRLEQPVFYLTWDERYLYVAMDSIESNTNTVVAACAEHDTLRIIGDDCLEMMLAPGTRADAQQYDFPTYYLATNALGTVWDARFVPLLNEVHNSWESGAEVANSVEGTRWVCEMRIPLGSVSLQPPQEGTAWRLNLDRTYFGYKWSAWNASGGLNDARVGGEAIFSRETAAVRVLSAEPVLDGRLQLRGEVANSTETAQTVTLRLAATGRPSLGDPAQPVGQAEQAVTISPGEAKEFVLGGGQRLQPYNHLTFEAVDGQGRRLWTMEREVRIPALRFVKRPAPEVPLVYIFPRYLASRDRLAVLVDLTAWVKKSNHVGPMPTAEIGVFPQGKEGAPPALRGILREFTGTRGTWRESTARLPEGNYTVKVKVATAGGQALADYTDWFEKRNLDWLAHPRGVGDRVPLPYTPLIVTGREIKPWGRSYALAETGLLQELISQGKSLLAAPATLSVEIGGKVVPLKVTRPLAVTETTPARVSGRAELAAGPLRVTMEAVMEYDGFLLYRLTYAPASGAVNLSRMRLEIPLQARYCRFYSAAGDTQGTTISADVLPDRQGKIYDSVTNTRSVACSPSFATLFWVGDYDTCFCYAADSDQGWVLRDEAPAVDAYREGDRLNLVLNLVDREYRLSGPRTLEFAFQAGPLRPLPEGWRGWQDGGYPGDAPLTVVQTGGSGNPLAGGLCSLYPGDTPQQRATSRAMIDRLLAGPGEKAVVGYQYWGTVPKGLAAARVMRGEWGIDQRTWDSTTSVPDWAWQQRIFGDNRDNYVLMYAQPVPSYVDFVAHAYDESLKETAISGFYDDTGYPKPVYDEELGLGFIREDGRKVYSSGLWLYRERWKRAAYLNFVHGRPNLLRDSQHVSGHFLPAYGLIGIWAPCERGYYNPFPDRDNLDFYGSLERYYAYNPARSVGQPAMVGMSSPQWAAPLLARDTRSMMLLAFLHDQDVGSFGTRDQRVVQGLRHARGLFRPWEADTQFLGYWQSTERVKCAAPGIKISVYHAPRGALFLVGNVGEEAVDATVEPDWKALGLEPAGWECWDAETGAALPRAGGTGFAVEVPRHDLRLVLAGKPGTFALSQAESHPPRPAQVLADLSEDFTGAELAAGWERDLHEGNSGVWLLDGRLCVQGAYYGYAHVRRKLGVDNISVQVEILRAPSGGNDASGGSLFLVWPNGACVQATPGLGAGKFLYVVSGAAPRYGSAVNTGYLVNWWPHAANWVKVALAAETIVFYSSADGKEWRRDAEMPRDAQHAGAPEYLLLGNGHPGEAPHLDNVVKEHFNPGYGVQTFFSGLVVGRD